MGAMWVFVATALVFGSWARQNWIDRTLVTVDVTGTWYGSVVTGPRGSNTEIWLDMKQAGSTVTGSARYKPDVSGKPNPTN